MANIIQERATELLAEGEKKIETLMKEGAKLQLSHKLKAQELEEIALKLNEIAKTVYGLQQETAGYKKILGPANE